MKICINTIESTVKDCQQSQQKIDIVYFALLGLATTLLRILANKYLQRQGVLCNLNVSCQKVFGFLVL